MEILGKEIKNIIKNDDNFKTEILDCINVDYYSILNQIKKNVRNKLINYFKIHPDEACCIKPYDSCLCVELSNVKIAKKDISTDSWRKLRRYESLSMDKAPNTFTDFTYFQIDCHVRPGLFKRVLYGIRVQSDFSIFGELIHWLRQEGLRAYIETKNEYFYDNLFVCPPERDN